MRELHGNRQGQGLRVGIVVAEFNDFVTKRLLEGCQDGLHRHGTRADDITVAWVPGSFEIPLVAKVMAESKRYDAVVALGAVVRGETSHYDYVAGNAASGVAQASLSTGVPVIFGILTTDTMDQAVDRAGGKAGNKGYDAAVAAIEMATLLKQVKG